MIWLLCNVEIILFFSFRYWFYYFIELVTRFWVIFTFSIMCINIRITVVIWFIPTLFHWWPTKNYCCIIQQKYQYQMVWVSLFSMKFFYWWEKKKNKTHQIFLLLFFCFIDETNYKLKNIIPRKFCIEDIFLSIFPPAKSIIRC